MWHHNCPNQCSAVSQRDSVENEVGFHGFRATHLEQRSPANLPQYNELKLLSSDCIFQLAPGSDFDGGKKKKEERKVVKERLGNRICVREC